jgi:2-amino-4-hydroxy-6-hydroxymethyldihydropteridine diphosphokinase
LTLFLNKVGRILVFRYVLAFGSNVGNREQNCNDAVELLEKNAASFHVIQSSQRHLTEPLPSLHYNTAAHEPYLNFVCEGLSALNPSELYECIVQIENFIGHSRKQKWRPREIDIDVLFAAKNNEKSFEKCAPVSWQATDTGGENFCVPHAHFWQRDFLVAMVTQELGIAPGVLQTHFALLSTF